MNENTGFDYMPKLTLDPNAATAAAEAPAEEVKEEVKELPVERPELQPAQRR